MIAHIVLLRLKPSLQQSDIRSLAKSLRALCLSLPAVRAAWVGPRVDIDAGYSRLFGYSTYDYAALLFFDSPEGLLSYLRHPSHAELGRRFWEICDATVVLEASLTDISSQEPPEIGQSANQNVASDSEELDNNRP